MEKLPETIVRRPGEEGITPFWLRIPRFFLYPLSPWPLLLMLGLACVTLLALIGPRFAMAALVFTAVVFLRYCYAVLDRTAFGLLSPGLASAGRFGMYRPWKQLIVLLLYGAAVTLTYSVFGTVAALAVQYGLLLLLPANVMWLGLTNSLFSSLNIVTLVGIIRVIGWPYLALYGFLAALSAAADTASDALLMLLRDSLLTFPAMAFAQMYFTLIAFNMLGYALYQYHDRLGLHVTTERPARPSRARQVRDAQRDRKGLDARIKRLLDEGRWRDASDLLYELVRLNPDDRDYNERYRALLHATRNTLLLGRHGAQYIDVLVRAGDPQRALEIYRECRRDDAAFHLLESAHQLGFAEAMRAAGEVGVATELIQDFDRAFPLSAERLAAYVLGARLLHEHFGDTAEARRLLEEVARRPGNDPAIARAREYLSALPQGRTGG